MNINVNHKLEIKPIQIIAINNKIQGLVFFEKLIFFQNNFPENLQKILLKKSIFLHDQLAKIFREKRKNASTLGSDRVRRSYSGVLMYYWYMYLLAGQI